MNNYINNTPSPSFTARNISIRKADEICRRVHQEFPVYSNTKLERFNNADKKHDCFNFINYVSSQIRELRNYYSISNEPSVNVFKMLPGLKKTRVGNCYEQASATCVALELNDYKNVGTHYLYAYNPKTKNIKDLDHVVSVVNIKTSNNYEYWNGIDTVVTKHLIKPNKDAIILDTWGGITDYANQAFVKYKSNKYISDQLEEGDKLMLLPQYQLNLSGTEKKHLAALYPKLLLNENKEKVEKAYAFSFLTVQDFPSENIEALKKNYNLINTRPKLEKVENNKSNKLNNFFKQAKEHLIQKIIDILFME